MEKPIHREDVKAAIRKRYGSLGAFETALRLPAQSVSDVLRGRRVARTEGAISTVLEIPLHRLFPTRYTDPASANPDDSRKIPKPHRPNVMAE